MKPWSWRDVAKLALVVTILAITYAAGEWSGRRWATPNGVIVVDCRNGIPQCPPDDDRTVIALWSDGETRLSNYRHAPHTGWESSAWWTRDYVTTWWELPEATVER